MDTLSSPIKRNKLMDDEQFKPKNSKRQSIQINPTQKNYIGDDDEDDIVDEKQEEQRKKEFDGAIHSDLPPYKMASIELREMQFKSFPGRYCEIRNIILAHWFENLDNYLCKDDALKIFADKKEAGLVFDFLERWGYINCGVFTKPETGTTISCDDNKLQLRQSKKIIIIGAGMAGVSAARQLSFFGYDVQVLEARQRLGGRCNTDHSLGGAVDFGGSVIVGLEGNPLTTLCKQLRLNLHALKTGCPLYDKDGIEIPERTDERVNKLFNGILDRVNNQERDPNTSLQVAADREQKNSCRRELNTQEERILNWHYANLEYGCAGELSQIAMVGWDQDDGYDYRGEHCMIKEGYGSIIEGLSQGLNIQTNCIVDSIEYSPDKTQQIKIKSKDGQVYFADSCIVTIPLGVLKENIISFSPTLPPWKSKIIERLGFGTLNKIILKFPSVFWGDTDYFGFINPSRKQRGEAFMFWNLHRVMGEPILVALASGESSKYIETMSEQTICDRVLDKLKLKFGNDRVPQPLNFKVTRWSKEEFTRGSYSFIGLTSNGNDYDLMADSIGNLYFAGEATCREHPATVAGALLSGLREAGKIDKEYCAAIDKLEVIEIKPDHTRDRKQYFSKNYHGHNPKKFRGKVAHEIKKRSHQAESADSWLFTDGFTIPKKPVVTGRKPKPRQVTTTTLTTTVTTIEDIDYDKSKSTSSTSSSSTSSLYSNNNNNSPIKSISQSNSSVPYYPPMGSEYDHLRKSYPPPSHQSSPPPPHYNSGNSNGYHPYYRQAPAPVPHQQSPYPTPPYQSPYQPHQSSNPPPYHHQSSYNQPPPQPLLTTTHQQPLPYTSSNTHNNPPPLPPPQSNTYNNPPPTITHQPPPLPQQHQQSYGYSQNSINYNNQPPPLTNQYQPPPPIGSPQIVNQVHNQYHSSPPLPQSQTNYQYQTPTKQPIPFIPQVKTEPLSNVQTVQYQQPTNNNNNNIPIVKTEPNKKVNEIKLTDEEVSRLVDREEKSIIASVVTATLKKHKITNTEEFKQIARKLTHDLREKEKKMAPNDRIKYIPDDMRRRIEKQVNQFMESKKK